MLDSSGGSVNDSIALGRRWRNLGAMTTVGISVETHTAQGNRADVAPEAYCGIDALLIAGQDYFRAMLE